MLIIKDVFQNLCDNNVMEKIELFCDEKYDLLQSNTSPIDIVKIKDVDKHNNDLEIYVREFKKDNLSDYLNCSGVYLIEEFGGLFYVGETNNFISRFISHFESRSNESRVKNITFACSPTKGKEFEKNFIKDIEAQLIEYSRELGLRKSMSNKIDEKFKSLNSLSKKQSKSHAKYIWDKFILLNTELFLKCALMNNKIDVNLPETNNVISNISIDGNTKLKTLENNCSVNNKFTNPIFNIINTLSNKNTGNYQVEGATIFSKKLMPIFLMMYLYFGSGGDRPERELLGVSHGGYITSKSLFVLGLPTIGARGCLREKMSEQEAKKLIEEFVETCYKW